MALWAGRFPERIQIVAKPPPIDVDAVQLMAYRYGLLICVTSSGVALYRRNGNGWARSAYIKLDNQLKATSLIVDEGRILLTTTTTTYVMSLLGLNDIVLDEMIVEDCRIQAKSSTYWVRFVDRGSRGHCIVVDFTTGAQSDFELNLDVRSITACVAADRIVTAARTHLHVIDPTTGQDVQLTAPAWNWTRIALVDDVVTALGYRDGGNRIIYRVTVHDNVIDKREFDGATIPIDFVLLKDQLHLLTEMSVLTLPTDMLTGRFATTDLQSGIFTTGPCLGIIDDGGHGRLIIRRQERPFYRLILVDPVSGRTLDVGHRTEDPPTVCIAEDKIVVAAREGGTTKIRTFMRPE